MKKGQTVKDQIITMLVNGYYPDVIADMLFTSVHYVKKVRRGLDHDSKRKRNFKLNQ